MLRKHQLSKTFFNDSNHHSRLFKLMDPRKLDKDAITKTWEAFGAYVSRLMRAGKGVHVPKFGLFSFSTVEIDMAV